VHTSQQFDHVVDHDVRAVLPTRVTFLRIDSRGAQHGVRVHVAASKGLQVGLRNPVDRLEFQGRRGEHSTSGDGGEEVRLEEVALAIKRRTSTT
jgi:hypothetical protein